MAGKNATRNKLYDEYKAQGLSDEEALMRADEESQVIKTEGETWVRKLKRKIKDYFSTQTKESSYQALIRQGYSPRDIIRLRSGKPKLTWDELYKEFKRKK